MYQNKCLVICAVSRSPRHLFYAFVLFLFSFYFFGGYFSFFPEKAHASAEIDISDPTFLATEIAIPGFKDESRSQIGTFMADIIVSDLMRSHAFVTCCRQGIGGQGKLSVDDLPDFSSWKGQHKKGTDVLLMGRVAESTGDRIEVDFRLWDLGTETEMLGQKLSSSHSAWRYLSHAIADAVYERVTGSRGYFNTKVLFVSESGSKDNRVKRLAIMDQDGANLEYLTDGTELVMTPRFSPDGRSVVYVAFLPGDQPQIFLLDLSSGKRGLLGRFPGMTFAPRFFPDGKNIVMSMQIEGNANIYKVNLVTGALTRLTDTPSLDTSPSPSPKGDKIVFESDRDGSQQLYVMNADGSDQRRISRGEGSYSTPVWSPNDDAIAFTKRVDGRFQIGLMRSDGSLEDTVVDGFHNEGPTWAPNGKVIMFFREVPGADGGAQLYSVNLLSRRGQNVPVSGFASDPAWSPFR